jgi:tRNA A58 N-methylase Trm61
VEEQDVTVVEEQQDHLKFIQKNLSRHVELKFRKVIHQQNVRSRDYSEEKKSAV